MRKHLSHNLTCIITICNHYITYSSLTGFIDDKDIDDSEAVEWCKWLVGGGRTPDDFSINVQEYNNTVMCGLVWTANFVAYRCMTCRISQCMSLCAECFRNGNHEGHDYNMFKSQAGGACDCGDPSVMRESGFCSRVRE